jgi:hypothetical protein
MALEREDRDAIVEAIRDGFKSAPTPQTPSGNGKTFGTSAVKDAGTGIVRVLNQAGGSLRDFAQDIDSTLTENIPVLNKLADAGVGVIGYIEDSQKVFQNLSKSGIGLNGNLGDLRVQAARTRMPLDQFANLVGQNAQQLVGLAGNASDGAKRFADLSAAMMEGDTIGQFMNLGYSIEEANEFVLKNTMLNRRQAMLQRMSDSDQVAAAAELAKQMNIVAKLTGKDAQQMQDELIARQRNGATQARLRLLEMDGVTGAQEAYSKAQTALDAAPDVVGDLFDDLMQTGAPMTEATKNFAATNQEAYALLQQAAEANKRGDVAEAERLAQEAAAATAEFAQSRQGLTLATLAQVSDIAQGQANVLEEMGPIIDATQANMQRIKDATGQELTFREAYAANLRSVAESITTQQGGDQPGQEALTAVNQSQIALANAASEVNQMLGTQIQQNSILLATYAQLNTDMANQVREMGANLAGVLNEAIPGTTLSENIGKIEMFATELQEAGHISSDTLANLRILTDAAASAVDKQNARNALEREGVLTATGQISAELATALQAEREANAANTPTESGSFMNILSRLADGIKGIFGFNEGTMGQGSLFQNFGDGTLVAAHDMEAITTPTDMANLVNSALSGAMSAMQNQLMGATFDPNQLAQATQEAMASMPDNVSRSGESTENGLDSLNQTMLQLVQINSKVLETANKQLRATKGLDGNMMTSVGI